ncbi:MAG: VIT domain-containing protein [Rhodoferax sp.]|nr:VIT domain-containing protein [Rhodoferax sp.]
MLLGVTANGVVKGRLLVMTLQQRYRNASNNNTEITYNFPLPHDAVLMDVEVVMNGKVLIGEVTARSTARAKYEEAIACTIDRVNPGDKWCRHTRAANHHP